MQMEEIAGINMEEVPHVVSSSLEACLPPAINENFETFYLQGRVADSIESHIQLQNSFTDYELLNNNTPISNPVNTDNEQKVSLENLESSIQQIIPDVPSQHLHIPGDSYSIHEQQTIANISEPIALQEIPGTTTARKEESKTIESFNLSGNPICDVVVLLPEIVALETSQDVLENIPKFERKTCSKVDAIKISNDSSAFTESSKYEERPTVPPSQLNCQKDFGHTQKNMADSGKLFKRRKDINAKRGLVDTAAPIESVKEVVTKFGGIVDWKAHKAHALENHKHVRSELERIQEEIPECKSRLEAAEGAKIQVLKELDRTKTVIEDLKLNLERAEKKEAQAKEESKLAALIEQDVADGSSVAEAKLEVARERHEAANAELKSIKEELKSFQVEYVWLIHERDVAVRKAQDVVSAANEIEKTVEKLTLELIATKGSFESAHVANLEAEEHRLGAALARDQDCLAWQMELKQAEEEVQQLDQQLMLTKDLKLKLDASTTLVHTLKAELAAYMKAKLKQESERNHKMANAVEETNGNRYSVQALDSMRKVLEEAKISIQKGEVDVNHLRLAASSLEAELDDAKAAVTTLKQKEGMVSIAVSSLEADLDRTKQELDMVRTKGKEARDKMAVLPKFLKHAAAEADQAKSVAQMVREELRKAKEEAEQAKAAATTAHIKFHAALRGTEAAKAAEKLALAAVRALQETEQAAKMQGEDSPTMVTLPLDQYLTLSRRAKDAEELARERVASALAQIEEAKKPKLNSLERMEETHREMEQRKDALKVATQKAEKAKEGKLGAEQELRKLRAELQQRRRTNDAAKGAVNPLESPPPSLVEGSESKSISKEEAGIITNTKHEHDVSGKKKKTLFFPRIVLFLARKKPPQPVN
ncbi:hypothetical protein Cni_G02123 [Canna indica]|uniref:Uncharacterized protein n=1 Tax=Canna indica TaxID=4628 RepID=A0AAQ3JP44_9LILI|nr:hypothetical protein Cni_G02123 [Canna indica]